MSVNRFGEIVSLLHFNDNNLIPSGNDNGYNKFYKMSMNKLYPSKERTA